uniref:Uncharacterized protein n=1 Tax=Globodera pallida TaxID=36090 RepID=A0A183BLD6_GLOPA
MTETNSGQIAPEQESSTSLNNAVRELQHIRARILELEGQQTTNASTSHAVPPAELEDGELSNSSVSTWSGTSEGSPTSSPPHRRVRFASPPAIPLPIPPPALFEPRADRTLVETSRRFRQPFRALHRMPTVRIIPPTQNHPPSFRTPFNTAQHRIVLPTQRPPIASFACPNCHLERQQTINSTTSSSAGFDLGMRTWCVQVQKRVDETLQMCRIFAPLTPMDCKLTSMDCKLTTRLDINGFCLAKLLTGHSFSAVWRWTASCPWGTVFVPPRCLPPACVGLHCSTLVYLLVAWLSRGEYPWLLCR